MPRMWFTPRPGHQRCDKYLEGRLGSLCGDCLRRFLENAAVYEAQAPRFSVWVP